MGDGNVKRRSQINDDPEGWVTLAALDAADIGPMTASSMGKFFLCPSARLPKFTDPATESPLLPTDLHRRI